MAGQAFSVPLRLKVADISFKEPQLPHKSGSMVLVWFLLLSCSMVQFRIAGFGKYGSSPPTFSRCLSIFGGLPLGLLT